MSREMTKVGNGFDKLAKFDPTILTDDDMKGYSEVDYSTPAWVSIRQKPLVDDEGNQLRPAGKFKVSSALLGDVPDPNEIHIIIAGHMLNARQYWPDSADKPECKSLDGVSGNKHGDCRSCPFYMKECDTTPILFGIESEIGVTVLRLSKSAVKPVSIYQSRLNKLIQDKTSGKVRMLPMHVVRTKISLQYKKEPQPHYVPIFDIEGMLTKDEMEVIREQRKEIIEVQESVARQTLDSDDGTDFEVSSD